MGTGDDATYHDRKGSVHPFVTPRSRGPEGNQAGMRGIQGRMASSVTALGPRTTLVTGRPADASMMRSMLIHRLEDERLVIFGGMWLEDFGPGDLEALGKPAFVVVTNPWHWSDEAEMRTRYPEARFLAPRACRARIHAGIVPVDGHAEDELPPLGIVPHAPHGTRNLDLVYEVRDEGGPGLYFSDLVFNIPHGKGLKGLIGRMLGSTGGFGVTLLARLGLVRRPGELARWFREQADRTELAWLAVGHGRAVTEQIPEALAGAARRLS